MNAKVLIADQCDSIAVNLKNSPYRVVSAHSNDDIFDLGRKESPSVIIGDLDLPNVRLPDLFQEIRNDRFLRNTPVILFTELDNLAKNVRLAHGEVDAYLVKPVIRKELIQSINTVIQRKEVALSANPLTKLPGNISIVHELDRRLKQNIPFAIAFIDLDNFKAYNDYYGFLRGDQVIQFTGQALEDVVEEVGSFHSHFIGHVGGDDFVLISMPSLAWDICDRFVQAFDAKVKSLYDQKDIGKGFIVSKDRQGHEQTFPLVSVSIGIVSTENGRLDHYGKICQIGNELKQYAKTFPGSKIIRDQRIYQ